MITSDDRQWRYKKRSEQVLLETLAHYLNQTLTPDCKNPVLWRWEEREMIHSLRQRSNHLSWLTAEVELTDIFPLPAWDAWSEVPTPEGIENASDWTIQDAMPYPCQCLKMVGRWYHKNSLSFCGWCGLGNFFFNNEKSPLSQYSKREPELLEEDSLRSIETTRNGSTAKASVSTWTAN